MAGSVDPEGRLGGGLTLIMKQDRPFHNAFVPRIDNFPTSRAGGTTIWRSERRRKDLRRVRFEIGPIAVHTKASSAPSNGTGERKNELRLRFTSLLPFY